MECCECGPRLLGSYSTRVQVAESDKHASLERYGLAEKVF